MRRNVKLLALFLVTVMFLSVLVSCGGKNDPPAVTTEGTRDPNDDEETYDLKGETFKIMERELDVSSNIYYEINATTFNSDFINNAIFSRNELIEERMNCVLLPEVVSGSNAERKSKVEKLALANDSENAYDIIMDYGGNTLYYSINGFVRDLNKLDYLDFQNECWYTEIMDDTKIAGKNTFAVGDMCTASFTATVVLFFNKTLAEQYDITNIYDMVFDGDWTFETYSKTGLEVTQDLDSKGTSSTAQYTFAGANWNYQPYFYGQGYKLLSKDEDGNPVVTKLTVEKNDALEAIINLVNSDYCWYLGNHKNESTTDIFKNSQAMFWPQLMVGAGKMRDANFTFGIVPLPKGSKEQEKYISYLHTKTSLVSVTLTNRKPDDTALLIEKLCEYSTTMVKPQYFDVLFDGIIARDDETTSMLDIIYDNVFMDMVQPLVQTGLSIDDNLRAIMDFDMASSLTTVWESYYEQDQRKLSAIVDAYKNKVK